MTTASRSPVPDTTGSAVLKTFRIIAIMEASSWLILIVATIVKYATTPHAQLGVQIMGPIHGLLFLVYVALAVFVVRRKLRWKAQTTAVVLFDSVLPFGGFLVARRRDLS